MPSDILARWPRPFLYGALIATSACCSDEPNGVYLGATPRDGSTATLQILAYLSVAESNQLSAEAWHLSGPIGSCLLYTLDEKPARFTLSSTDPQVASINPFGMITAHAAGETTIMATAGLGTGEMFLRVSPPVAELRMTAPAFAQPGDTIDIHVTAIDQNAQAMDGVYVSVTLLSPGDSVGTWTTGSYSWNPETVRTPEPARLVADQSGVIRVVAVTAHEPGYSFVTSDTAQVTVTAGRRAG